MAFYASVRTVTICDYWAYRTHRIRMPVADLAGAGSTAVHSANLPSTTESGTTGTYSALLDESLPTAWAFKASSMSSTTDTQS